MKSKTVITKNVARLFDASEALTRRAYGLPGMGVVYSPAGLGKSTAIAYLVVKTGGIYVCAAPTWTPSAMLEAICEEVGIAPRNTCTRMLNDLQKWFGQNKKSLWIDESEHIIDNKKSVETLRHIHDMTLAPVVLIGMKDILKKLKHREALFSRLMQQVNFQPLDLDDAQKLADELCEVQVQSDLVQRIFASPEVDRNHRKFCIALAHCEAHARRNNLKSIGIADIGRSSNFFSGELQ